MSFSAAAALLAVVLADGVLLDAPNDGESRSSPALYSCRLICESPDTPYPPDAKFGSAIAEDERSSPFKSRKSRLQLAPAAPPAAAPAFEGDAAGEPDRDRERDLEADRDLDRLPLELFFADDFLRARRSESLSEPERESLEDERERERERERDLERDLELPLDEESLSLPNVENSLSSE